MNLLKTILFFAAGFALSRMPEPLYAGMDYSLHNTMIRSQITYLGGGGGLAGTIPQETYLASSTSTDILFGEIDFSTGPVSGYSGNRWYFGPGGTFSVTGSIYSSDFSRVLIPVTTLLTGSLLGMTSIDSGSANLSCTPGNCLSFYTINAQISAAIDQTFAKLLGLPGGQYAGSLNLLSIGTAYTAPPDQFSIDGLREIQLDLTAVPEPTPLILLGTAALFVVIVAARAARAKNKLA
jgi:hypothetical protein